MSNPPPVPLLEISQEPASTTIRITGCNGLTDAAAEVVGRQLFSLVEGRTGLHLVLDLEGIAYLTSTGLGKLIGLHRRLQAGGGRLTVRNAGPSVWEIFSVTRLDRV